MNNKSKCVYSIKSYYEKETLLVVEVPCATKSRFVIGRSDQRLIALPFRRRYQIDHVVGIYVVVLFNHNQSGYFYLLSSSSFIPIDRRTLAINTARILYHVINKIFVRRKKNDALFRPRVLRTFRPLFSRQGHH